MRLTLSQMWPPGGENLMAFEMRFARVCRMRSGSAQTSTPWPSRWKRTPLLRAAACCRLVARSSRASAGHMARCSSEFPLEMRSMSRMSLTRRMRRSVFADGDFEHLLHLVRPGGEGAAGDEAEGGAQAGERSAQLMRDGGDELVLHAVELLTLGGVGESDDDADGLVGGFAVGGVNLRTGDVFDGEAGAVLAPEDFIFDADGVEVLEGGNDGAGVFGVGGAVGAGVLDEVVELAAEQVGGLVAEHLGGGGVDDGDAAFHVEGRRCRRRPTRGWSWTGG